MKRHASQIQRDAFSDIVLHREGIQRISINPVSCYIQEPGEFVVCVCAQGPEGEQHNYMMRLSRYECDSFEFGPMDPMRELLPECERIELETRKKRQLLARMLSEKIAYALLDHIEKNDPQFGYTRKQWDEMNKP